MKNPVIERFFHNTIRNEKCDRTDLQLGIGTYKDTYAPFNHRFCSFSTAWLPDEARRYLPLALRAATCSCSTT